MTKPGPGKFESNPSLEASQILYEHSLDGSHNDIGESDGFGWFVLIMGEALSEKEKTVLPDAAYICEEDNNGFFTYYPFANAAEAVSAWGNILDKYADYSAGVA